MEEKLELNDIADNLLIINQETIERLFQEENKDTLVLYMFYYKTAKWQKHNPIKASDDYTMKCLHWGDHKLKNIKKRLKEMELIEIEKRFNEKKQVNGWYIRVNYFNSSGAISSSAISPLVAEQHHKILLDNNNINTNNNNKKEIYKERNKKMIEATINYLNKKTGKNYRPTTPSTVKHLTARINEGYNDWEFMDVIDTKCKDWLGTDMEKFLRPETLFGSKFENYLNQ